MAGAIEKKINEVEQEIKTSPNNHLIARAEILDSITITREFSQTMLHAVCKRFTSSTGNYTLAQVCENLAEQRAICYGARDLKTSFKKFSYPSYETVNGALGLTEPNTSFMGIRATEILDKYTITLSNTDGTTQTEGGNTFSTYIGDYYLVRSRVSGELIDVLDDIDPYSTPDSDTLFGNTVAWGADVSSESSANTWNYNWAKANVDSIAIINPGSFNELTTLTLSDHLTQGSNTDYNTLGPSFGQKFYLKRHTDHVNTFTITGTATTNSVEITNVSDEDMLKVKYSDIISAPEIPMGYYGPTTIASAKITENKIRISNLLYDVGTVSQSMNVVSLTGGTWPVGIDNEIIEFNGGGGTIVSRDNDTQLTLSSSANVVSGESYILSYGGKSTSNGIITLTVNSVPFGYAKDDIFCQVEVVAEGLVINDGWKPVGDGLGNYGGSNEGPDDTLTANTTQFVSRLGFFDPDNGGSNASNDLTRSARNDFSSEGKEYNITSYPYIEKNPFKPAVGVTHKAYTVENGEITGTQPTGLTGMDIHTGRYIRWDGKRADATGAVPENRYYTDTAEKFYYELPCNAGYSAGSVTVSDHPMPNSAEPPKTITKTGLSDAILRIQEADVTCVGVPITVGSTGNVPVDGDTSNPILTGPIPGFPAPPAVNATIANYYTLEADNYIYVNRYHIESVSNTSSTWTATVATDSTAYACRYNFAQRHIYNAGGTANSSMNADTQFIASTLDDLQSIKSFRDPVISSNVHASGISDADWDSYISTEPDADLALLQTSLKNFRDTFDAQNRTGANNSNTGIGTEITYANTEWSAFHSELSTFSTKITARINEIDARIGTPTRSGTQSTAWGSPPAIYVSAIPSSNTTGGYVPYGKSIYNNVNNLLGKDIDLLGKLIQDVQGLGSLIDLVKKSRNKYEIYNGRDKEYTDV